MPQQRSRTRAVIPGKAILGAKGAELAARSTLGGAVVPGPAILGDVKAKEEQRLALEARRGAAAVDAKNAKGPAPKPVVVDDTHPPLVAPRSVSKAPPPIPSSLSEKDVKELLDADPESWEHIMDLEAERPDGIRPAVAAAVLAVVPRIVENPIPEDALDGLRIVAQGPDAVEEPAA